MFSRRKQQTPSTKPTLLGSAAKMAVGAGAVGLAGRQIGKRIGKQAGVKAFRQSKGFQNVNENIGAAKNKIGATMSKVRSGEVNRKIANKAITKQQAIIKKGRRLLNRGQRMAGYKGAKTGQQIGTKAGIGIGAVGVGGYQLNRNRGS